MLELMQGQVGQLIGLDANELAERAGSALAVNMVLLGALLDTAGSPLWWTILSELLNPALPASHWRPISRPFIWAGKRQWLWPSKVLTAATRGGILISS